MATKSRSVYNGTGWIIFGLVFLCFGAFMMFVDKCSPDDLERKQMVADYLSTFSDNEEEVQVCVDWILELDQFSPEEAIMRPPSPVRRQPKPIGGTNKSIYDNL